VSSASRVLFALILSSAPAFPLLLVSFAGLGYGTGLTDTAWNSWASSTSKPNVIQGILHGSFSVGCVAGPALATIVLRKSAWPLLYGLLVSLFMSLPTSNVLLNTFKGMRAGFRTPGADLGIP
jgi:MFS family permease